MSTPKRSLETYFQAARHESSPIQADEVQALLSTTSPTTTPFHGASMIPSLITAAVMTLAGVGGAIVIHDDTKPVKVADKIVATTEVSQAASAPDASADAADKPMVRVEVIRQVSNGSISTDDLVMPAHALSINVDDLHELSIRPEALSAIAQRIGTADSIMTIEDGQHRRIIRIMRSGRPEDISFGTTRTPMPVMITLASGQGRCLTSAGTNSLSGVDPNMLVPIRSEGPTGNVMMWFSPTVITQFPDSLRAELETLIDIDVQIDADSIQSHVKRMLKDVDVQMKFDRLQFDSMAYPRFDIRRFNLDSLDGGILDGLLRPIPFDSVVRTFNLDCLPQTNGGIRMLIDTLNLPNIQSFMYRFETDSSQGAVVEPKSNVRVRKRIQIMRHGRGSKQIVPTVPNEGRGLQETKTASGALSITSIYPNPTSDGGATIAYTLSDDRRVQVSLHDLTGSKLMDLGAASQRRSGAGQIAFTLDGVSPGIYLVTVTTERGERAVQRLIVQ
jgi:hypothetical protein